LEVPKAVGFPVDEFHLVVKAFGDAVVCWVKRHMETISSDQAGERVAELNQLCQAGLAQLVNGPQKTAPVARTACGCDAFSAAGSRGAV